MKQPSSSEQSTGRIILAAALVLVVGLAVQGPLAAADDADVVRLSEPVQVTDEYETFGNPLPDDGPIVPLAELLDDPNEYLGRDVIVRTRVAQVCQKKGCFFIAQDGEHVARVSFVDYSFFVPSDISGRTVTLAGRLVQKELTAPQAEHFSADLGEGAGSEVLQAGPRYEIVATSVRVPLS